MGNLNKKTLEKRLEMSKSLFSKYIKMYQLSNNEISATEIYKKKLSDECRNSFAMSTFYNFCNGITVPSVYYTEMIFDSLGIKYDRKELKEMLEQSQLMVSDFQNEASKNSFITSVSFKYSDICDFIEDADDIAEMLERRKIEIADGNFSKYITMLIKNDLNKRYNSSEEEEQ